MGMEDFYNFGSKMVSSTVQAHPIGIKDDENRGDSHLKLIKGNYFGIHFPVIFKQAYGKKFTDILGTTQPPRFDQFEAYMLIVNKKHAHDMQRPFLSFILLLLFFIPFKSHYFAEEHWVNHHENYLKGADSHQL